MIELLNSRSIQDINENALGLYRFCHMYGIYCLRLENFLQNHVADPNLSHKKFEELLIFFIYFRDKGLTYIGYEVLKADPELREALRTSESAAVRYLITRAETNVELEEIFKAFDL